MDQCPKCESTKVVRDMILQTSPSEGTYVVMENPAKKGDRVHVGFRVDVCVSCGYTEMKTKYYQDLADALDKGFVPRDN